MQKSKWRFYNHALIPYCPEMERFSEKLSYNEIVKEWKSDSELKKSSLFCMYPTDFDCKNETSWWYNIKDDEYNIDALDAKKRYELKKGIKNFHTELIDPRKYVDEIFEVYEKSFSAYPEKYRPTTNS